jgi:hypothetical protein
VAKVVKMLALPSVIQCVMNVWLLSGHWIELRVIVFWGVWVGFSPDVSIDDVRGNLVHH